MQKIAETDKHKYGWSCSFTLNKLPLRSFILSDQPPFQEEISLVPKGPLILAHLKGECCKLLYDFIRFYTSIFIFFLVKQIKTPPCS